MKKYLILFLIIGIYSCDQAPKAGDMSLRFNSSHSLRYFKDSKTNNCFVERGIAQTYSFTCVKCDSLFEKAYIEQFNK